MPARLAGQRHSGNQQWAHFHSSNKTTTMGSAPRFCVGNVDAVSFQLVLRQANFCKFSKCTWKFHCSPLWGVQRTCTSRRAQESFPDESFPGEPLPGESFTGEPLPGESFTGELFSGESFTAELFPGESFPGELRTRGGEPRP